MENAQPEKRGPQRRLGDSHCILILLALTLVFFRNALFSRQAVIIGSPLLVDLTHQFYPWRLFGFGLLKRGVIPLWNPYLFCGQPFIANMQSAIFYPLNLVYLALPVHAAINWSFAGHVFLAGAFTYAYVRYIAGDRAAALVSAAAFMFSAPVILRVFSGHLSVVCALPWFPLELLAVEAAVRKRRPRLFLLGAAAVAAQFLAGQPQYVFYSMLAVFLYLACRCAALSREYGAGRAARLAVVGIVLTTIAAAGLSAVQLFPGMECLPHSARAAMSFEEAAGGALPPENYATLLVPEIFGDFHDVMYWGKSYLWEVSLYAGVLPLCLALLALLYGRNRIVFVYALLAAASLVVAMGTHTPVFRLLYTYVPGFSLFRGTNKALFVAAFCVCFMAGFGFRLLAGTEDTPRARRCVFVVFAIAAIAWTASVAVALLPDLRHALWNGMLIRLAPRAAGTAYAERLLAVAMRGEHRLLLFLTLTLLLFMAGPVRRKSGALFGILAVGIVVADLWSFGSRYVVTSPESVCWWPRDIAAFFLKEDPRGRYLRDIGVSVPGVNQGMNDRLYGYQGYDPHTLKRYSEFVNTLNVRSESAAEIMERPALTKVVSLANLKHLITPASTRVRNPDYAPVFDNGRVRIYENRRVLPRAWVVHGARVIPEPPRLLEALRSEGFDPESEVLLEEEPGLALAGEREFTEVEVARCGSREIEVRARLDEPGILVLADTWYPGWEALVDGGPRTILRANYLFRAVPLEIGAHTVVFRYRPASFRYGAWVSLVSLALALVTLFLFAARGRDQGRGQGQA